MTNKYFDYLLNERGLAAASISVYRRDLTKLTKWIAGTGLAVESLTNSDLREFVMALSYDGLAPNSVHRVISSIAGYYRFLLYEGHIKHDPAKGLTRPQIEEKLPRFLSTDEMMRLSARAVTDYDKLVVELLYGSGLRVSELVSLRVCDVELDRRILTVTGKGDKQRRVPLSRSSYELLTVHLSAMEHADRIFYDANRQDIWAVIKRLAAAAGLSNVSPHTLRHTFATHLHQNGADVRSVQAMLGHARIDTTAIYTHIPTKDLVRRYNNFHPRA